MKHFRIVGSQITAVVWHGGGEGSLLNRLLHLSTAHTGDDDGLVRFGTPSLEGGGRFPGQWVRRGRFRPVSYAIPARGSRRGGDRGRHGGRRSEVEGLELLRQLLLRLERVLDDERLGAAPGRRPALLLLLLGRGRDGRHAAQHLQHVRRNRTGVTVVNRGGTGGRRRRRAPLR